MLNKPLIQFSIDGWSCVPTLLFTWGQTIVETSLVAQKSKAVKPTMWETQVQSLGWEDLLEKEMATHSSILAWKIPRRKSLVGYSPWGRKESDTTDFSPFHKLSWR